MRRRQTLRLDHVPVIAGGVYLLTAVAFRAHLWSALAGLHAGAPEELVAGLATLSQREQLVLFPLGVLTTIAAVVAMFHEGVRSWRGYLRLGAVVALVLSAVVFAAAIDPIANAAAETLRAGGAEALTVLARRWVRWQWVNFALALVVGVGLFAAHRLPAPAPASQIGGLSAQHRTLLLLLGAATLFEGYDRFIVSLALPYIGRDLGASEGQLGFALSLIRIGALLSLALGRLADRHGRRRVLLLTIVAYTVATAATGLSQGLVAFVAFQLVACVFLTAELALAQVVIAEEFPADARGRGQGLLGAFAALGAGVAAILFPLMQHSPLGWRGLYFVGILPLLLIAYLRRTLPETKRFEALSATDASRPGVADVLRSGLRKRFLALTGLTAAEMLMAGPTFGFISYHATHAYGWTPAQVSLMMITAGGIGLSGWFIFGRLADSWGRRFVGVFAVVGASFGVIAYYRTPWLLPAFTVIVFLESGVGIAINSLGTELFPTALRATAKSWITNAGILGAMLGLAIVGVASEWAGGADVVIACLAIVPLAAAPLLLLLPETSGQELEALEEPGGGHREPPGERRPAHASTSSA